MTKCPTSYIIHSYFKSKSYLYRKEVYLINKFLNIFFYFILFLTIFISVFFVPVNSSYNETIESDSSLLWPAPGISKINSYFGKRKAPTGGASTFHKGVDIGAPEGFEFIAVTNGTISFVGFLGGGGFTITLTDSNTSNGEIKYSYCHSNPNFIVKVGDKITKGQIIGKVGPKYVDGVSRK